MNEPQEKNERVTTSKEEIVKQKGGSLRELLTFAVIVLIIFLPIRLFIAQPFIVSGESMYPTFANGDYLIIDEISYRIEKPERGDIVVLKSPSQSSLYLIKRVIGLPGETIEIVENSVSVKNKNEKKGVVLNEPYVSSKGYVNKTIILRDGEYFVMGDNRGASSDSRIFGAVPADFIKGRVLVRLLPVKNINFMPGKWDFK